MFLLFNLSDLEWTSVAMIPMAAMLVFSWKCKLAWLLCNQCCLSSLLLASKHRWELKYHHFCWKKLRRNFWCPHKSLDSLASFNIYKNARCCRCENIKILDARTLSREPIKCTPFSREYRRPNLELYSLFD